MRKAHYVSGSARGRYCRGFSLLEVIVAFALLAMALTLLLGVLSGAARQVRDSEQISRASLHAQSILAQMEWDRSLEIKHKEGVLEKGDYRWTLEVTPYRDPSSRQATPGAGASQLQQLDLEIRWGEKPDQAMHWRTLRLVSARRTS